MSASGTAQRVDLDDLDLAGADGGYDSYWFEVDGIDLDFGEPQPVEVTIATLMGDGVRTDISHYENREIPFRVRLYATDAKALADGEAALTAKIGRRVALTWQPSDELGPPTVFDVETSRMRFMFSDLDEARRVKRRTYQVTLNCLPFGRSAVPVTIGSAFVADSETIEDDCEDEAGWSVYRGTTMNITTQTATITVDSTAGNFSTGTGSVKLEILPEVYIGSPPFVQPSGQAILRTAIRKTGLSIDASGGGYFMFRFKATAGYNFLTGEESTFFLTSSGGGRQVAALVSATTLGDGFTKFALLVPDDSTITAFEVEGVVASAYGAFSYGDKPPNPDLWFDSIGLAAGSTENQAARTMDILGSVRTEGSFQISAAVGLGDVLFYNCPDLGDGFRPDLARYRSAGTPHLDAGAINGSYVQADEGEFEAPANIYRPGAYAVLARVHSTASTSLTLGIAATTVLEGTSIGATYTVDSGDLTVADTTDYHVIRVGVLDLPPHKVASAADAVIWFVLDGASTVHVDEIVLFPLEDAALTWLECGSGAPAPDVASRVWIDPPSPTLPCGQILVGNDESRADARYLRPESKGKHFLYPGRNLVYLMTSTAGGADLQTSYYPRAHSNNAYAPDPT